MRHVPYVSAVAALLLASGAVSAGCSSARELAFEIEEAGEVVWFNDGQASVEFPVTRDCLDIEADADLPLEWCIRLSPESEAQDPQVCEPGGEVETSPGGAEGSARCGFFNMVQTAALRGTAHQPVLAYCDPDLAGGVRGVWYDGQQGRLERSLVADEGCIASPHGIDLLARADGTYDAAWLTWDDGEDELVHRVEVGGDAVAIGAVRELQGARGHAGVDLVPIGAEGGLLLGRPGDDLALAPIAGDAIAYDVFVDDQVQAWGSAEVDGELILATCDGSRVVVETYDPVTLQGRHLASLDSSCGWGGRLAVAGGGGALAVGWEGVEGGSLWFFAGGEPVAEVALGPAAARPAVVRTGEGFLTVDGEGWVRTWTPGGEPVGRWSHPNLVGRAARHGEVVGLHAITDGEGLVVATVGQEYVDNGVHQYTYQTLELSRVVLPTAGTAPVDTGP